MLGKFEYYLSKLIKKMHFRAIRGSVLHPTAEVCAGSLIHNSEIGKYSYTGYDCNLINVKLGAFCSLGSNIKIGGASHPIEWASSSTVFCGYKQVIRKKFAHHDFDPSAVTVVGNDVWIADNVAVKAGVTIGDGAVIGTSSVITKDVGPYEIWAGNPARLIRKRFDDETIDRLMKIQWWAHDDEIIEEAGEFVTDVDKFITYFENRK